MQKCQGWGKTAAGQSMGKIAKPKRINGVFVRLRLSALDYLPLPTLLVTNPESVKLMSHSFCTNDNSPGIATRRRFVARRWLGLTKSRLAAWRNRERQ